MTSGASAHRREAVTADYQSRVATWVRRCFGNPIATDRTERNHRFLEEALELVQANGCTAGEAQQLVEYVFSRAAEERSREVGGVMVTLAALCSATGDDMSQCAESELDRCWVKIDRIPAKHAAKPKHSPLPAEGPAVIVPDSSAAGGDTKYDG